jgi:hypothetical protein
VPGFDRIPGRGQARAATICRQLTLLLSENTSNQ